MAFVYRNHNTGDEVTFPARSARLDRLGNWELVSEPEPAPAQVPDESGGGGGSPSEEPKQPGRSDPKADWVVYIAATTDLSEAEAGDLTKAELVALTEDE